MLSISQKFSLTDLLRKMISMFDKSVPKDQDVDYYADKVNRFLYSNRYLIILDDVWTVDMWNELKEILPDVKNGSRVLMTTRFLNVATLADSKMSPYKLKFLDERESLDLLLKKAFPYQKPNEECPLLELALKLSNKCKGLPLALIVLGSILATKELSYPAWERVLQTMDWHSDGNDCMQILAMSYKDMPLYLKECFRYLASFPEDYEISAQCLIRMWAAEGFLEKGRRTIEMMAEECLEQLAERSMVQVLSRSVNGLIKHFKVHDIIRELAMHEANDANSVMVFSRASDGEYPSEIIRRASLQAQEKNSQMMDYIGPKTRSLILFDNGYGEMSLQCSNFRLLRVLEFVGMPSSQIIRLKSFGELNNLKYLGIRECSNIDLSYGTFHGLKRLETLDVRGSHNFGPYDGLWTISTLKHVLAENYGVFFRNRSLILEEGILMSNIETLKWVRVTRACDANLPNLRKLGIQNIESDQWNSITNLLPTLPVLVSLGIHAPLNTLPMEIVYPKALPQYQNLQTLFLRGKWPENVKVEASLLPPHLLKLTLKESNLSHDPMQELAKLKSLKKLHMGYCVLPDNWQNPIICEEGFPSLQYVKLNWRCNIKDLTVAPGVMPNLKFLKNRSNTKVHIPRELQHVTVQNW